MLLTSHVYTGLNRYPRCNGCYANKCQHADSVHKVKGCASWRVVIQLTKKRACVDDHDPSIGEFIFEPAVRQHSAATLIMHACFKTGSKLTKPAAPSAEDSPYFLPNDCQGDGLHNSKTSIQGSVHAGQAAVTGCRQAPSYRANTTISSELTYQIDQSGSKEQAHYQLCSWTRPFVKCFLSKVKSLALSAFLRA